MTLINLDPVKTAMNIFLDLNIYIGPDNMILV